MSILNSLSRTESSGNTAAYNNEVGHGGVRGHGGRLQFGHARLQDAAAAGLVPKGMTPKEFSQLSGEDQAVVEQWHKQDILNQAERRGLNQYIGQEINGALITPDAIVAMAHLGGMGGASQYLKSGGRHNPSDSFGTSLSDYARTHAGASAQTAQRTPPKDAPVAQNTLAQPQTAPENALSPQQQQMAAMQQFMPQHNALSASDFQSNSAPRPVFGFGAGNNPFV